MSDRYEPDHDAERAAAVFVDRWCLSNSIRNEALRREMVALASRAYSKGIEFGPEPREEHESFRQGYARALAYLLEYANGSDCDIRPAMHAAHAHLLSRRPK